MNDHTASAKPALSDDRSEPYYAHSKNPADKMHLLSDHLTDVSDRAAAFAEPAGLSDEARLTGLLHDLGKYGHRFQLRLQGKAHGIDHWSAGAWDALMRYKQRGVALALAIQGHHLGMLRGDKASLGQLNPVQRALPHPGQPRPSEDDHGKLVERLHLDGLIPPDSLTTPYDHTRADCASSMLDVRMLFSALVDADFLDTEAHFAEGLPEDEQPCRESVGLQAEAALDVLLSHVDDLSRGCEASDDVAAMRTDLLNACLGAAGGDPGLYTLSAPTGAGKTLSMLAFALKHAIKHNLRRIVCVIPFLSIIEQTAAIYRDLFQKHFGAHYVLEHHSLAGTHRRKSGNESDDQDPSHRTARLLSENWDAPLIVTTSVQCLESLMANRPGACRKLHRLARSVILFDEVQTLPPELAPATLATLSHLSYRYGATVVFSTATQPAFEALDRHVKKLCVAGWTPVEVVSPDLNLFDRARRTRVHWPDPAEATPWPELADRLSRHDQVLCIVNLRRHARELALLLHEHHGDEGLFHLSTSMCPAHREAVLEEVRQRLDEKLPCRLVSTQCVEAGVDIDFPAVYRAFAPLEAIAQAAGRCNRKGRFELAGRQAPGEVFLFVPDDPALYPPGAYTQAAEVTRMMLAEVGPAQMDINDPSIYERYYRSLYDLTKWSDGTSGKAKRLVEAINTGFDFETVAQEYRLIDAATFNVLVPYNRQQFEELADRVRREGLSARWIARARPHSVGVFRHAEDHPVHQVMEPVPVAGRLSEDWFVCIDQDSYDPSTGFVKPETWRDIV